LIGIRFGELFQSTNVITVVMRDHHVVDLLHPGISERQHDAIGIPPSGVSRIDSTFSPDGERKSVDCPPSVSMK
jgi:hypothetical protein